MAQMRDDAKRNALKVSTDIATTLGTNKLNYLGHLAQNNATAANVAMQLTSMKAGARDKANSLTPMQQMLMGNIQQNNAGWGTALNQSNPLDLAKVRAEQEAKAKAAQQQGQAQVRTKPI